MPIPTPSDSCRNIGKLKGKAESLSFDAWKPVLFSDTRLVVLLCKELDEHFLSSL